MPTDLAWYRREATDSQLIAILNQRDDTLDELSRLRRLHDELCHKHAQLLGVIQELSIGKFPPGWKVFTVVFMGKTFAAPPEKMEDLFRLVSDKLGELGDWSSYRQMKQDLEEANKRIAELEVRDEN